MVGLLPSASGQALQLSNTKWVTGPEQGKSSGRIATLTGPEQGKSSGRIATFSLWTGIVTI